MNYVKHLNLFGVEAKEIPALTASGAPTTATEGAVGLLYMDNLTGDLYKCTAVAGGVYTWVKVGEKGEQGIRGEKGDKGDTGATGPQGPKGDTGAAGKDAPQEAVLYLPQTLTDAQKAQARENIGAQPVGDYALKSEIPSVPVQSVNGKTGLVQLSASDVGALPESTTIPAKVSQLANDKGYLTEEDVENILAKKENEGEIRYLTPAFTKGSYMGTSGTIVSVSDVYAYTEKIAVAEGDVIEAIVASTSLAGGDKNLTFTTVTAFVDGEAVGSLGVSTAGTATQYIVPATVTEVVVSAKFFETAYSNQRIKITPANYGEEEETASLKLLRNDYSFSLPKKLHLKKGDTAKIYLRNLTSPNYLVRLGSYTDSTTIRACEETVQITGNAVANKTIQYAVYDNHYNLIEEGSTTLSILGTAPASQKMLLIGDSFIATSGGYFGSCLSDLFTADGNTLTLVGTKGTSPKNHEGYSGKKYTDFANGFSGSPFGESGFNFSSYMSANGYSGLSSVYIQLGTNDVSATNPNQDLSGVIAAMNTIVNSIRSYSTSIKIYVGMTVMPNLDSVTFANTYNGTGFNWIMKQNMLRLNDLIIKEYGESSSVTLVANNCILDSTEDILDNVHPTNAGFAKMAKQLYYTMMS